MATRNESKARNDVLEMLKQDHRRAKKAFSDFVKLADEEREGCAAIVEQACAELEVHAALEEEIFYPAVRRAIDDTPLIDEAEVEHKTLKMLIQEIDQLEPDDARYAASFKVLGEYTRHHVKEEEGEIFELLGRARIDWETLLQEMQQRRAELIEEIGLEGDASATHSANGSDRKRVERSEIPE